MPHAGRQIQQFSARPSFLRSSCRRRSRVDGVEVYLAFVNETYRPVYARDHPLDVHTLAQARDLAAPSWSVCAACWSGRFSSVARSSCGFDHAFSTASQLRCALRSSRRSLVDEEVLRRPRWRWK